MNSEILKAHLIRIYRYTPEQAQAVIDNASAEDRAALEDIIALKRNKDADCIINTPITDMNVGI